MMSTRRELNRSFWLGRTAATAIMVLVGLGVFAGSAQAQNAAIVLDNVEGWWDHLGCEEMINSVNAVSGLDAGDPGGHAVFDGDETFSTTANNSTREWCGMFDELGANQQRALNAAAKQSRTEGGITTKMSDRVFDLSGWWDGMDVEGRQIAIGAVVADISATPSESVWAELPRSLSDRAEDAYMYLMSGAMPTDEAPALPLAGLGILGLLLAGRGAWLRRRS